VGTELRWSKADGKNGLKKKQGAVPSGGLLWGGGRKGDYPGRQKTGSTLGMFEKVS